MSNFTTPLDIRYLEGEDYLLLESFDFYIYYSKHHDEYLPSLDTVEEGDKLHYTKFWFKIPAGFITDFASVPKPLQILISKTGKHGKAAVLHDYLYRCALQNIRLYEYELGSDSTGFTAESDCELISKDIWNIVTQNDADRIFNVAMKILNVNNVKRFCLYKGVDWFGHFTFDSHSDRNRRIPEFRPGQILKTTDLRIGENIPLRVEVEKVRRNLIKFKGVEGEFLNYNFKPI